MIGARTLAMGLAREAAPITASVRAYLPVGGGDIPQATDSATP